MHKELIHKLVGELPEVYQPIFGHPEYEATASRQCHDRLVCVKAVVIALEQALERPVRVLDLGSAQGFFSLSLAAHGATVVGIDFLAENIRISNALAEEFNISGIEFVESGIEEFVDKDELRFDLVLGLSVFHHLIAKYGEDYVTGLIAKLSNRIRAAVYELAVKEEPQEWAIALPNNPDSVLASYSFSHVISYAPTHLSGIDRPIYFASNSYYYIGKEATPFDSFRTSGNALLPSLYGESRLFYFAKDRVLKKFKTSGEFSDKNLVELNREIDFLLEHGSSFVKCPSIISKGKDTNSIWLERHLIPGESVSDLMSREADFPANEIADQVLDFLVKLEQKSLYHSDLRPWNVIYDKDIGAHVVDYGAITSEKIDTAWPYNVFLSFIIFLRQIFRPGMEFPVPIQSTWIDPRPLPEPYRSVVWSVLESRPCQWSFTKIQERLNSSNECNNSFDNNSNTTLGLVMDAYESGTTEHRRHIVWLEEEISKLASALESEQAKVSDLKRNYEIATLEASKQKHAFVELEKKMEEAIKNYHEEPLPRFLGRWLSNSWRRGK